MDQLLDILNEINIDVHYDTSSGAYYAVYPAYPNGTDCDHCNLFFAVNRTGKQ